MGRTLLIAAWLALASVSIAFARKDEPDNSVNGSEEAFGRLREIHQPDTPAFTVEDAIDKFFPEGEDAVDEGSYPATDAWERDFDLRRVKPEEISYSGRIFGRYSDDAISGIEKWEKELELNLGYGDWDAYFRFGDFNNFAYENDPLKWEKARLRYRHGDTKLTIGTYSVLFGRGLALNIYEDRIVEHDTELEGVKLEQRLGDAELTVLTGTWSNGMIAKDFEASAARIAFPLGSDADVGVHAVEVTMPVDAGVDPIPTLDYSILGADLTARLGDVSLFAETAQLDRDKSEVGNPFDLEGKDGTAHYVNLSYSVPRFSISGEYKHYEGMAHPFNVAPPVKRWFENASADLNDEEGWATEMALDLFDDGSLFTFRYGQTNSLGGLLPHHEFYASYASPAEGEFSWIGEWWEVNKYGDEHSMQQITANQVLSEDYSTTGTVQRERIQPGFGDPFIDYIFIGELAYQSTANLNFIYETTGEENPEVQTAWRAWEVRYRPDEDQEFNLLVGTRRDGFVCSGGICRLEPAFDGLKLDYLRRF